MTKILIYGVGNPYKCDDAVGIKVAETLKTKIAKSNITIKSGSIDGLAMLNEIVEYDIAIFIDSIKTKNGTPGDVYKINFDPLKNRQTLGVSHGIDFATALKTGQKLGYTMPKRIAIFAIEIEDNTSFNEECTDAVKQSIPEVVSRILDEIAPL